MIKQYIAKYSKFLARGKDSNNATISNRQKALLKIIAAILLCLFMALFILVDNKTNKSSDKSGMEDSKVSIDLPDKGMDTEKHWRDHFAAERERDRNALEEKLKLMQEQQNILMQKTNAIIEQELSTTHEKLKMAQQELASASLDLKRAASDKLNAQNMPPSHQESALDSQGFNTEVSFARPRSAANYIPEGTYFTGHLLGGIVVSTALNTPSDNATPVSIQLEERANLSGQSTSNLSKLNKLKSGKCRIMGSAYGDISSERAVIRLEKMICEEDGMYVTSKIAGQLHGPDGYNGIKGSVVSTNSKHIKNAMLGGIISGVAGSAKGQDSTNLSAAGIFSTKKKGMSDMLTQGMQQGTSNAADKVADYYLRQAEAMSPVLTIPSGVRVNAQITKGFFVGEASTHQKIRDAKQ